MLTFGDNPFYLYDHMPVGVFVVEKDYTVVYWNSRLESWTEIPRGDILGKNLLDVFPHLNATKYTTRIDSVFYFGPPAIFSSLLHKYIIPVKQKDGRFRIQETTVTAIAGADGKAYALFTIQDVTELAQRIQTNREMRDQALREVENRKAAQEALKESEEKYRKLFSNAIDAVSIFDIETKEILDVNNAFLQMYGYTREEALNLLVNDVSAEPEKSREAIDRSGKSGDVLILLRYHKKKNGTVFPVELSAGPYMWKGRKVMFSIIRDITARVNAERALRESEKKLHNITSVIGEGVYALDMEGRLTFVNPEAQKLLGWTEEELLGKDVHRFIHHSETGPIPPEECAVLQAIATGNTYRTSETWFRRKDGNMIPATLVSTPIMEDGRVTGSVAAFHDITEARKAAQILREAMEKAERATELKDKFVSLVAHDLKSPLSSILGMLRIIFGDEPCLHAHQEHYEAIGHILSSGDNMINMIDELLNISRFQSGKVVLKRKFLDARLPVSIVIGSLGYIAKEKGITIINDVPQGNRIYADFDLLVEVLRNLLSNAIKFCRRGDTVTFFVPKEHKCVIAVKDTGVGIGSDILPDIFRHEVKTSLRGTAGEPGTGLGLPYCHDIMHAHNGSLEVESEEGAGTTFYVRLPYVRPRVVIVEDEDPLRYLYKTYLRMADVETVEAGNGREALAVIEKNPVHLVIADIAMPVMDGFQLLETLKGNPKTEQIPVMIVTADTNMETRERTVRMGADDFITKPIAVEEFIPRIRKFII